MRDKFYEILFYSSEGVYRRYFKRKKKAWNLTKHDLLVFKEGQLGHDYRCFLNRNQLDILPKFERHDIMHVLTATNTQVKNEVALQFYLLGNGKLSVYQVFVLISSIGFIDQLPLFIRSYKKGKQALPFHQLSYEELLHVNTSQFIEQYNITKL